MKFDNRKILVTAALLLFMAAGIGASLWSADRLRESAREVWLSSSRADAARMTETVLFWISKAEVNLRAIAGQFRGQGSLDQDRFFNLIEDAKLWDPDVTFENIAYVQRVLRKDREAFEKSLGKNLTTVVSYREKAPDTFENFAVRLVAHNDGSLRLGADLATLAAMKTVVVTARQTPGNVVLGPAFKNKDGDWNALIATATDLDNATGVLAAIINLKKFFASLAADHQPLGMQVRLIERDNEARASNVFLPIIGTLNPPQGAAGTEIINITSGQARWGLHWDILPEYLGGPSAVYENFVKIGGSFLTILITAMLAFLSFQNIRFQRLVKERTAELAQNAMIIQLTMDSIDQGFAVWNTDHRLVVWSKYCLDFWYQPKGILRHGMHLHELLTHIAGKGVFGEGSPEDLATKEMKRIISSGHESEETFTLLDGRKIHVRRFPLDKGGHVGVYTDITSGEQAKQKLVDARDEMERRVEERTKDLQRAKEDAEYANRSKTSFLANVSHELRTPLNAIIGFSDMMKLGTSGPIGNDFYESYINFINQAGVDLLALVNDILDISKVEARVLELDEENFDVVKTVMETAKIILQKAQNSGVDLVTDVPNNLPALNADRVRLKQILLNLLDNAVKFTEKGGRIDLSADIDDNGNMIFKVQDNGIGIAPENLPTILEPFSQVQDIMERTHTGSGLGLPLSKTLTELHGGSLGIESKLGQGTTVTVTFPAERTISA